MKDKEKQIEEMAKIIYETDCAVESCEYVSECVKKGIPFSRINTQLFINTKQAESIYEQGYRDCKDKIVIPREAFEEKWIDLLTEFDEMGFEPTTLPPQNMSVEEYTAFYKSKLLMCLATAAKGAADKILNDLYNREELGFETIKWYAKAYWGIEIKEPSQ